MTSATDKTSCISHRRNSRFFVMYEDFLDVAKVSEHQYKLAAFWRVMETKTNDRISYNEKLIEDATKQGLPEPETNLWLEVPYSDFVKRSLGVYKASSFQVAAAESERLGFTESRTRNRPRNPLDSDSPLEEYKEYRFNTDVMQSVLNGGEYPTPIEINRGLLKSIAVRKEKRAIEKNSTPVDFNRGGKKTPVKNNSTPLLKSTGNNITEESTTENEQEESTFGVSTDVSTPTPAPDLSDVVDDLKDSVDGAYEHLTGKSPVEAAMEDSYSLTQQPTTTNSSEERETHDTTDDIPAGRNPGGAHAHLRRTEGDQGHGTGTGRRNIGDRPSGHSSQSDGRTEQQSEHALGSGNSTTRTEQATNERRLNETSAQNPATVLNRRGAVQRPVTAVGASAQDTSAVVAGATGNSQAPSGKKRGKAASSPKPEPESLTDDGQRVYDAWCSLFISQPLLGPQTIKCANALMSRLKPWCNKLQLSGSELLADIKDWLYATDGDYYRTRGVSLCDVGYKFEKWQSAKTQALTSAKSKKASSDQSTIEEEIEASRRAIAAFEQRERASVR